MKHHEDPLGGGYVNHVVRVGDTVHRRVREPRPFVHEVLRFLEEAGWPAAPRFLGFADDGCEVLSWIDGHVPWSGIDEPAGVYDETAAVRVAQLTRELHDLTAGTALAGDAEVVCHNDLSLKNTVYRPSNDDPPRHLPVAFLDWDLAAPGRRLDDVAHVCWQWAGGTTTELDVAVAYHRAIADAYGLSKAERADLVERELWWQDRCWRGIQRDIDAGIAGAHFVESNAVAHVQGDYAWTVEHRTALERAVR